MNKFINQTLTHFGYFSIYISRIILIYILIVGLYMTLSLSNLTKKTKGIILNKYCNTNSNKCTFTIEYIANNQHYIIKRVLPSDNKPSDNIYIIYNPKDPTDIDILLSSSSSRLRASYRYILFSLVGLIINVFISTKNPIRSGIISIFQQLFFF